MPVFVVFVMDEVVDVVPVVHEVPVDGVLVVGVVVHVDSRPLRKRPRRAWQNQKKRKLTILAMDEEVEDVAGVVVGVAVVVLPVMVVSRNAVTTACGRVTTTSRMGQTAVVIWSIL